MLRAIVGDLAKAHEVCAVTTWDDRLGPSPFADQPNCTVHVVKTPAEQRDQFAKLAAECDWTLLIAPEFDGILGEQCRFAEALGARLIGPSSAGVEVCTDKFSLARSLQAGGVPTIDTYEFHAERTESVELQFPVVIKPRDGAGSQSMYLVRTREEFNCLEAKFAAEPMLKNAVWQPFVPGAAMSVGLIIVPEENRTDVLPVCEQKLSTDGRFTYLGGGVPARGLVANTPGADASRFGGIDRAAAQGTGSHTAQEAALRACRLVPGLRGYVGVDLIVPFCSAPIVVEINPRLTTSFLGYQALAACNLAARMLPGTSSEPIAWRSETFRWDSAGHVVAVTPDFELPSTSN